MSNDNRIRSWAPWRNGSIEQQAPSVQESDFQDFREPGYASPKGSRTEDTSYFQFAISPQLKRKFDGRARELKISASELLRRLIEKECEE